MPVRSTVDQVARRVYCFCPKLPSQPSLEKNASRSFQQCLIHAFCHTILLQRMSNSVVANNPLVLAELIELKRTKFQTIISSSESESSASATVVEPLASPFLPSFFFFFGLSYFQCPGSLEYRQMLPGWKPFNPPFDFDFFIPDFFWPVPVADNPDA